LRQIAVDLRSAKAAADKANMETVQIWNKTRRLKDIWQGNKMVRSAAVSSEIWAQAMKTILYERNFEDISGLRVGEIIGESSN
jgi:hypothetical protein